MIMALDPSINFCGCAIFSEQKKKLLSYILITPDKSTKDEWLMKARSVFEQVRESSTSVEKIVIEIPEHWGNAGYLARESGALFKVTFLAGMICSLDNVITVTPSGWKGQLPKDVMRRRFIKYYPDIDIEKMNHNILDAIGIGHWYLYKHV